MKRLPVQPIFLVVLVAATLSTSLLAQSRATAQGTRTLQELDMGVQPDHPIGDPSLREQIPTDWKIYEDAVWNISLRYPPDWEVTAVPYRGFGVRLSSPDLQWDDAGQVIGGSYFWIDVTASSLDMPPGDQMFDIGGAKQAIWTTEGYTFNTVSVSRDTTRVSPLATELILSSFTLTGQPGDYPTLPLSTVTLAAALKLPFPSGIAYIASGGGYNNNDRHLGKDKYALDFCLPDSNCQLSKIDDYYVLAPTNLTYINVASDQSDYYFFEIAADTEPSFKLCMSLAHFNLLIPIEATDLIPQGTVLGNMSSFEPPHWHMGIWATAKNQDCRIDLGRVPISYEDWSNSSPGGWNYPTNPGDLRLDGISYPVCDGGQCTNVHANKQVISTNVSRCYTPNTNSYTPNGQLEDLSPDFDPADCFNTNGSNVDVALIIDSSGSMSTNDPSGKRLDAGKSYLTASLSGDYVGVVDFDDSVRFASPLQRLPENKDALIAAINTINSSGGTNIGMGVEAGCGVLQGIPTPNLTKGAILLTDGNGDYNNQAQCFIDHGWPIYAFGFGSADDALLEEIATSTGGEYKRLPTSNLVCEFQSVRTKIAGGQPSPCTAQMVEPNETVQFPVNLLERLLKVTFSISWPGSDVELSLVSPSGRVIDRSTDMPDVEHDLGATYESYGIINPEQGEWQVKLFGADVPAEGEEVVFNYATILDPSPEPDPPQDFTASDGTLIAQVDLTWTQSEGATYYEIYRSTLGASNWEFLHTRDGQYDFSSDGLNIDGTVLEYAAKACSDVGCSELSISDTGYADVPVLQDIDNADGDGDYIVEWTLADTASHHELQENYNGGVWTEIYSGNEPSIYLIDTPNGQWCYRVRGYNGIQYYSPWTPVKCTTVFEEPPPVNELYLHLPVILNSTGFNQPPPLSFVYPQNGQVLDYGGHYFFKVTPYLNAEGYLWGFFQNGQYVWENMTEEGTLDGPEYAILSGTEAHNRFRRGAVDVWVRASINNGNWTEPTIITIFLE